MGYEAAITTLENRGTVAVEASASGLAAVAAAFGCALPEGLGTVAGTGILVRRFGPESLALHCEAADAPAVAAQASRVLGETAAIAVDVTDGYGWVSIAGRDTGAILAQGVAIDLRSSALPIGHVVRTLCFGVEAVLHRLGRDEFCVGCRASEAEFLLARLMLARDPAGEASPWL